LTSDVQAAANRARAFLAAWDEHHTTRDQVLVQVKPGSADMLTSDDLRTLLDAIDPQPTIEWGVHFRFGGIGGPNFIKPAKTEHSARAQLAHDAARYGHHTIVHRHVIRRPDDIGDWIEGEPAHAEAMTDTER